MLGSNDRARRPIDAAVQLQTLNNHHPAITALPRFHERLRQHGLEKLDAAGVSVLQLNLGKKCNQTCRHCHVDAGPHRKEVMTRETMAACLKLVQAHQPKTVDLTGGAPELNPHFRWLVEQLAALGPGLEVIDRCNLTILLANRSFATLPRFLAGHRVHIISSLPYFSPGFVERQRGEGVFDASIVALRLLNTLGYGTEGSGLLLDLVYNPCGAFLPADQAGLQAEYKARLCERYGVVFNRLFTITNMPISRFLEYLLESGNLVEYMEKLVSAFNPAALEGLMCRSMLSIGWDGTIYDCDFNQMLELPVIPAASRHVNTVNWNELSSRRIRTDQHCFGCAAGAGSSCRGALTPSLG